MKKVLLFVLLAAAVIIMTSCKQQAPNAISQFIPTSNDTEFEASPVPPVKNVSTPVKFFLSGTYVAGENTVYANTSDTIVVKKRKNHATLYDLHRRIVLRPLLSGKQAVAQAITEEAWGSYDENNHTLYILSKEMRILAHPDANTIELAGINYQKVE